MVKVDLNGKVALVTGGSRGLGRSMAKGLAAAGATVMVVSRKLEACEQVCEEIKTAGGQAIPVAAHLGDMDSLDSLIERCKEKLGKLDILINNAGINPTMGALSELSPELFDKMYQVNLKGPWYLASRLAPFMAANGGGKIVNIVSVGGLKPAAFQGFYATLKAALNAMTRVMAAEWAADNIQVNAIAPGSYHSDLFDTTAAVVPGFEDGARSACLQQRIAETDEIMGPIMYLVSELGSYTTGTTVVADGGYLVL